MIVLYAASRLNKSYNLPTARAVGADPQPLPYAGQPDREMSVIF